MAKNRNISPDLAWSEYEEEKAWECAEEELDFINYDDDTWNDDEYLEVYEDLFPDPYDVYDEIGDDDACEDQDSPTDDYWFYLTGSYSTSYLEIWEKLEAEKEAWALFESEAYEEEQEELRLEMSEEMPTPAPGRALRRRNAYNRKQHLRDIADVASKAYRKRDREDYTSGCKWRCKRRGGHEVRFPKSLGLRSINVIRRAKKMNVA